MAEAAQAGGVRLLSGGNPQIPKGDGDGPVQAWIAAVPGWKQPLAVAVDAIITAEVPGVAKAVKWNSPFYGRPDAGWFLSLHCYAKFLRVTFFAGAALHPMPAGASKHPGVRYHDIADGAFDTALFESLVRQASLLPGAAL